MKIFASMGQKAETEFYRAGPEARQNLRLGEDNFNSFRQKSVYEVRPYQLDVDGRVLDPLNRYATATHLYAMRSGALSVCRRERQIGDFFIIPFYGIDQENTGAQFPVAGGGKTQVYCCDTDRFETFTWKDAWKQAELGTTEVWGEWDKLRVATEWDYVHALATDEAFRGSRVTWGRIMAIMPSIPSLSDLPPYSPRQLSGYLFDVLIQQHKLLADVGAAVGVHTVEGLWLGCVARADTWGGIDDTQKDIHVTHIKHFVDAAIRGGKAAFGSQDDAYDDTAKNDQNRALDALIMHVHLAAVAAQHHAHAAAAPPNPRAGFAAAAAIATAGRPDLLAPLHAAGFAGDEAQTLLNDAIGRALETELSDTFGKTPDEVAEAGADPHALCDEYLQPHNAALDAPLDYYASVAHAELAGRQPAPPRAAGIGMEAPRATGVHIEGADSLVDENGNPLPVTGRGLAANDPEHRRIRCYDLLCVRPFRRYTMGSGILVKKGSELGNTYRG